MNKKRVFGLIFIWFLLSVLNSTINAQETVQDASVAGSKMSVIPSDRLNPEQQQYVMKELEWKEDRPLTTNQIIGIAFVTVTYICTFIFLLISFYAQENKSDVDVIAGYFIALFIMSSIAGVVLIRIL